MAPINLNYISSHIPPIKISSSNISGAAVEGLKKKGCCRNKKFRKDSEGGLETRQRNVVA
jgi:hypothetical protein